MVVHKTIKTDAGNFDLIPAELDQLRAIARFWPMELVGNIDSPVMGLIFQHGAEEVWGVKIQPPDVPLEDAKVWHHVNRALIASALPYYLEKGHKGVLVPCAYLKKKESGLVETGIAMFAGPDSSAHVGVGGQSAEIYDEKLGIGATKMIFDMAGAIAKASKACNLPFMTAIGIDLRPRLAMGGLAMHFVIAGPTVFVVKDTIDEREPVWGYLVRAGFTQLPYMPMQPAGFEGSPDPNIKHV